MESVHFTAQTTKFIVKPYLYAGKAIIYTEWLKGGPHVVEMGCIRRLGGLVPDSQASDPEATLDSQGCWTNASHSAPGHGILRYVSRPE